ncbi:MAG: SulP family inorganic anion transporter [Phycisphaerales bacterium]|nr:SulP family inorganic anion transporter [Phycisphaerales bacterium]
MTASPRKPAALRADTFAGLTVALVSIPQGLAFAAIAGLPAVHGLYAVIVGGLVSSLISGVGRLNIGPAVTTSSMVYAVLATVAPDNHENWPALAGALGVLVGLFTLAGAALRIGRFVRFVSRSVLLGFTVGAALLITGSQLAPMLGLDVGRPPTLLGLLIGVGRHAVEADVASISMAALSFVMVLIGGKYAPRFPTPFIVLALSSVALRVLSQAGLSTTLARIGAIPRSPGALLTPWFGGNFTTDLVVGAGAMALVGLIQTLSIAKAISDKQGARMNAGRELAALGAANLATGALQGLPVAGSFVRSALNEVAGARTRVAGVIAAIGAAAITFLAAPLAAWTPTAAIAGLLVATAVGMVDWRDLFRLVRSDRHDRIVLLTMIGCVFVMPIHWAVLVGMALSAAIFMRRAAVLRMTEMISRDGREFRERRIDAHTGKSAITLVQIEGPLFFAHADEIADVLAEIFSRKPSVVIVRMRRTHQLDYTVIAGLDRVVEQFQRGGGVLIVCGLTRAMRRDLIERSSFGARRPELLLTTGGRVFGSALHAVELAEQIVKRRGTDGSRPLMRSVRSGAKAEGAESSDRTEVGEPVQSTADGPETPLDGGITK